MSECQVSGVRASEGQRVRRTEKQMLRGSGWTQVKCVTWSGIVSHSGPLTSFLTILVGCLVSVGLGSGGVHGRPLGHPIP